MTRLSKLTYIVIAIGVIITIYTEMPSESVRFFCSHDRVFIEFEENGKVWGTMWTDEDGRPVNCDSKVRFNKTQKSREII